MNCEAILQALLYRTNQKQSTSMDYYVFSISSVQITIQLKRRLRRRIMILIKLA